MVVDVPMTVTRRLLADRAPATACAHEDERWLVKLEGAGHRNSSKCEGSASGRSGGYVSGLPSSNANSVSLAITTNKANLSEIGT